MRDLPERGGADEPRADSVRHPAAIGALEAEKPPGEDRPGPGAQWLLLQRSWPAVNLLGYFNTLDSI